MNRRFFLLQCGAIRWLGPCSLAHAATVTDPIDIHGVSQDESERIRQDVQAFMQKHSVPGLSLAMSYQGRLKLLVCMGYADRALGEPVRPKHRFRIASVSKPITSVLILLLRQKGYLDIDQPVLGQGILGYEDELAKLGAENQRRLQSITTRQLLEHTAGGWSNQAQDPMFTREALELNHNELIRWTLAHRNLEHHPGTTYAYSNFGYCLLGRIIEKTTKMNYEEAVRAYVLKPFGMGALSMSLGGNTLADRQANEVIYYGQQEDPYDRVMNVRRMDAHGGWVASPTDLVRLTCRVDGFTSPSDLLNQDSIRLMTLPSSANGNYAKGWSINRSKNWWHTGSFNGSSSILARIHDGHCWAMVMNTRSKLPDYGRDLDALPWKIKRCVQSWGSHDLFDD